MAGWIKLHRQLLDSRYGSNLELMGFWACLLMLASHKESFTHDGTLIKPGQLMTSRDSLALRFGIHPSKVYRMLLTLQNENQIEQRKSPKNTIITITKWDEYQDSEQQTNNERTTDEQRANTFKNVKNVRMKERNTNCEHDANALQVLESFNKICGKNLTPTVSNLKDIKARLNEIKKQGRIFDLKDFEAVVMVKHGEWAESREFAKYVRPSTLFGPKFETYLDQATTMPLNFETKLDDFFNSQGVKPAQL